MSQSWYALYVPNGEETKVKAYLEKVLDDQLTFHVFTRALKERKGGQWRLVQRKLFPGYILVQGHIDVTLYEQLRQHKTKGHFIKDTTLPAQIHDNDIKVLNALMRSGESSQVGVSSCIREGQKIKILDGPLKALEGQVISIDHRKQRAKVRLPFMGEARIIDFGIDILTSI